jgi:hypothetical protein
MLPEYELANTNRVEKIPAKPSKPFDGDVESLKSFFAKIPSRHMSEFENQDYPMENDVIPERKLQQLFLEDVTIRMSIENYFIGIMGEDFNDPDMIDLFLYTYKWYLNEENLFRLILRLFLVKPPLRLSRSERELFSTVVITKLHVNLLNFLKKLIKLYSQDFAGN